MLSVRDVVRIIIEANILREISFRIGSPHGKLDSETCTLSGFVLKGEFQTLNKRGASSPDNSIIGSILL